MPQKVHLVVIDPQNSFCKQVDPADQQKVHDGELCVPGAWEDMERVAAMVTRLGRKLSQIHVTLDSHHQWHIAHPIWYKNSSGQHPNPFTVMREENGSIIGSEFDAQGNPHDIGEFTTTRPGFLKWTLSYLKELAVSGRYPHVVWPFHCLIGTPGHNVVAPLMNSLLEWKRTVSLPVNKVTKGSCIYAEHFSAVRAEVPHPQYPDTQLNADFIGVLAQDADEVLVSGEALSHCVANTFKDTAEELGDDFVKKLVLLEDASSNVPNFDALGQQFVADMTARGMRVTTTTEYLK